MILRTTLTYLLRGLFCVLAVAPLQGAVPLFAQTVPAGGEQQVEKLIAVLKSDAPPKEKAEACRGLAVIGGKDAVPALTALLGDERLSHIARYALEPIPDPAVDEALRDALGKLKGRPLVGVIGSVGVRRDVKAVDSLAKMLGDTDADVAQAAARALGKIATVEAAKALQEALAHAPAANQLTLCEGLFRAAEALAAKDQRNEAMAIYDRLRDLKPAPQQVRAGALRGAILTRGKEGAALLRQQLRSDDYVLFAASVRAAQELPGREVTLVLAAAMEQLPADRQIVVIQTLSQRGETAALRALAAAAKRGEKVVRLAAVRALPGISAAGGPLMELLDDPDAEIARAAQESLASLEGAQVDAAVMAMLDNSQMRKRLVALELIGQRRMTKAIPALLKATADADPQIRSAAVRRLGDLGGHEQLPALVDLLLKAKARDDLAALEQALSAACARSDAPQPFVEKLLPALEKAQPAQKAALLRVLGTVGGAEALKAVQAAVQDADKEVRATAVRTLSAWKTADAVASLLALASGAADPTEKMLAWRGYLGWAAKGELPLEERLAMCRRAAGSLNSAEEKKLLLSALGSIAAPEAVGLILPHLDAPATRDEATAAALAVAEGLLKGRTEAQVAAKLIEPLEKVAQAAANTAMTERAKTALKEAQNKAGRK